MKAPIFMFLFLGAAISAFPLSLQALLGNETAAKLLSEGELTLSGSEAGPAMAPRYVPLSNLLRQTVEAVRPNVITESLYLYTKPSFGGSSGEAWTDGERAAIYNETLALSTLAGLEYYSRRRGRMHVLYESSRVVDEADTKRTLPDPVYQTPPAKLNLYARQKDTTFGDNVYRFTYEADEAAFIITQENVSTITLAFVPVVGKRNLCSVVAFFDAGPHLLLYAVSLARVVLLPGIKDQMYTSIGNRTAAFLAWFSQRADIAYAKTETANRKPDEPEEPEGETAP
ncbi:MAG: hypothetical protein LBG27_03020 [Spirochaetaceae bacterium]|nr:hypothetical protein [Spirochaetaceae bacterium]